MIDEATVDRLTASALEQGLPAQVGDEQVLAFAAALVRRAHRAELTAS